MDGRKSLEILRGNVKDIKFRSVIDKKVYANRDLEKIIEKELQTLEALGRYKKALNIALKPCVEKMTSHDFYLIKGWIDEQ